MTDPFTAAAVCVYFFGTPDLLCFELLKYSEKEFIDEARIGNLLTQPVDIDGYPGIPAEEEPESWVLRSTYQLGRRMDYF